MRFLLIISSILLSLNGVFAQNEIDTKYLVNSWKVINFGNQDMPPASEFTMIFKFSKEGVITIGSQFSVQAGEYKLHEDNSILVSSEGIDETWTIVKLTEKEFVFTEKTSGTVTLIATEEDLPAVVMPVEEEPEMPIAEAPQTHSIDTDFKPTKKTAAMLVGAWQVKTISGITAPEGMSLEVNLSKDGAIEMLANGEKTVFGTWKLSEDKKKITITGNQGDEFWGIKSLDEKQLVVIESSAGEIVMEKKAKEKKK